MRGECQARMLKCDNGDVIPMTSGIAIEVISDGDLKVDAPACGQPAVDGYDRKTIINGKPVDYTVLLCAEHWDLYQKLQQESD